MRSVAFCSPTGITILAAAVEHLWAQGKCRTGEIWLPNNPLVQRYLVRMNFAKELGLKNGSAEFTAHPPKGFRPVTHVENEQVSPAATRELVEAVRERHKKIDGDTVAALKSCMNELVENVFYHAVSPIDALVSVQAYKSKQKTEIVIADTGRGIKACLEEVPVYRDRIKDDYSAIGLAIQKNVTTTGDERRGIGLWLVSELVRHNGGEMLILSNEGGMKIDGTGKHRADAHFWPGTLVAIEFRMDQPISTQAVYGSAKFPDIDAFDF
jgi:anti-sigma regulatory factor (Ser/Thr protein kinase)